MPALVCGTEPPAVPYDADIHILSLGRVAELMAAVDSALSQTGLTFHVSVLDQGSTSAEMACLLAFLHGRAGVSFYCVKKNLGVGGGRNFLASRGGGRIIIALDNDAVFAGPDVAAQALRRFDAHPTLGALGFQILNHDGSGLDETSWGYPQALRAQRHGQFLATTFVGAGHAIRRDCWMQAGEYDATLFFTWEEYDFCLNAIFAGWLVGYDGTLAVRHNPAPQHRVGWRGGRLVYQVRNRLIIARKWREPVWGRAAGYVLQSLRNGRPWAGLLGCLGAATHPLPACRAMPDEMRAYIIAHEASHRGGFWGRFQSAVVARLPAPAARANG